MKYALKIFLLVLFTGGISGVNALYAQYLDNPSFEDDREANSRENSPPADWYTCDAPNSSPDTPPGILSIELGPQDGITFLSLRTRADNPTEDPIYQATRDKCYAPLRTSFKANHCYSFNVWLATDEEVIFIDELTAAEPVKFQVHGFNDTCEVTDLLAETEPITNLDWQLYELSIVPEMDYNNLLLQSYYDMEGHTYHGMNLVDNIQIEEVDYANIVKWDTAVDFNTEIELMASEGSNYVWYDPDSMLSCTYCRNPVTTVYENASFFVEFDNVTGCSVREEFKIHSLRCTSIDYKIKTDTSLDIGDTPILEASLSPVYTWDPIINLSCRHCKSPIAFVEGPVEYRCEIYDQEGCKTIERFIIRVEITVPDVFTPNGDGYNDMFVIKNLPENSKLKIFDRNGVLLYKSGNYLQDWDGRDMYGNLLPNGNYWYALKIPYSPEPWNGSVYLKRK